ncbi:hypothetical protein [Burkholderia ubonensis]|uniref:hypothetical protein n=1 Tax=Burkholderia ubonensis TaxID=101571 RepID=UPI002FCA1611
MRGVARPRPRGRCDAHARAARRRRLRHRAFDAVGTRRVPGRRELRAIRNVFGDAAPPLSSTKSTTGHAQGAAGVHEFIYALLMLNGGFIAPSANIERLDDGAHGFDIVTAPTSRNLTTVMTNSFGFGGVNATLVMTRA